MMGRKHGHRGSRGEQDARRQEAAFHHVRRESPNLIGEDSLGGGWIGQSGVMEGEAVVRVTLEQGERVGGEMESTNLPRCSQRSCWAWSRTRYWADLRKASNNRGSAGSLMSQRLQVEVVEEQRIEVGGLGEVDNGGAFSQYGEIGAGCGGEEQAFATGKGGITAQFDAFGREVRQQAEALGVADSQMLAEDPA